MKYSHFTEQEVLEKSRELLHAFVGRQIPAFLEFLDKNFVWVGDYNVQYTKGITEFLKQIEAESSLPPFEISHEEYSMLTRERHTWVTYGRFTVTASMPDSSLLAAKIHFTFVWKQHKDSLKLLHAHAAHVVDSQAQGVLHVPPAAPMIGKRDSAPPRQAEASWELRPDLSGNAPADTPQAKIFDRIRIDEMTGGNLTKIRIKDLDGNIRFLFPAEVLYIKSDDKLCTIHTETESFVARTTLRNMQHSQFLHIHRSYLVNLRYIESIRRYKATLTDGTQLPIGKERYMEIQKQLTVGHSGA